MIFPFSYVKFILLQLADISPFSSTVIINNYYFFHFLFLKKLFCYYFHLYQTQEYARFQGVSSLQDVKQKFKFESQKELPTKVISYLEPTILFLYNVCQMLAFQNSTFQCLAFDCFIVSIKKNFWILTNYPDLQINDFRSSTSFSRN